MLKLQPNKKFPVTKNKQFFKSVVTSTEVRYSRQRKHPCSNSEPAAEAAGAQAGSRAGGAAHWCEQQGHQALTGRFFNKYLLEISCQ